MRPTIGFLLTLLALAATGSTAAQADASQGVASTGSDLGKEQRWRAQIVDSLMDGDAVDLQAGDVTFLGLYTAAEDDTGRGAVIVHGIGVHPNWPQVVYPLRTALPQHGWSTLSIQMPVLPNEATEADYAPLMDEVAPRLDAAIAFLKGHGSDKVAIIGHSLGATMAITYLAAHPNAVNAFIAIGTSTGASPVSKDNADRLSRIGIPTLDLFGQNDLEPVIASAPVRAKAAAVNPDYRQVQVPGADHFFDGHEDELDGIVEDWLNETVPAQ